ncbi:hypothetical protein DDZ16_12335 [Marinilabilia rubra]|uniref:Uncharacterized protein n=1 Tax=Marinilabilia rubra TaxID=2162893 RepID=A0A2U2B7M4_9BACT|nr:hypothetical protein DDZ16_12335 [Marinilabilia rubra]
MRDKVFVPALAHHKEQAMMRFYDIGELITSLCILIEERFARKEESPGFCDIAIKLYFKSYSYQNQSERSQ